MLEGNEAVAACEKLLQETGSLGSNRRLVLAALKACGKSKNIQAGKSIHSYLIASREDQNASIGNTLVHMYARCKSMPDARWAFDRILHRDSVSWNTLLFGYLRNGDSHLALELFQVMQEEDGCSPDARTFVAALKACATCAEGTKEESTKQHWLQNGVAIHSRVLKGGYESDIFVASSLMDMYSKRGRPKEARRVLETLRKPDVICWNAVLFGYTEAGDGSLVFQLFKQMQDEGCVPDAVSYVAVFKACSSCGSNRQEGALEPEEALRLRWLEKGRAVHLQASDAGLDRDMIVASTLVDMYSKCRALEEARRVFDKMPLRDTVAWNSLIFGHVESGEPATALELFSRMKTDGCFPNPLTYVAALKACGSMTILETGRSVHAGICRAGLEAVPFVATSLVDLYGKCGLILGSQQVFDSVGSRHLAMWNALVAGYANQGNWEEAFHLFDTMLEEHLQVDGFTFVSVLALCTRAGVIDRGLKYFQLMERELLITPDIRHYSCMVDLLCRANRVDAAVSLVKQPLSLHPDVALWRTILAACQRLNNVELGKLALEAALELDDKEHSSCVLMANAIVNSLG